MPETGAARALLSIDADSWKALNELLDAALDLPEPERAVWIDALESRYDSLKPQLRALLGRASASARFETIPKIDATMPAEAASGPAPDAIVGPYRIERQLGEGGMGTVWLARRTDGMVNRPVALKLPRQTWRHALLAQRLGREREILAGLNHANIARLYDAGITAEGQPFLALEYVEGTRIDQYCDQAGLGVRDRVRLFLQVLGAVEHAHSRLVIHRDLKPSNILVTSDGQVKLLDFGIAKLLETDDAVETQLTGAGGPVFTPAYASPEQMTGEPASTASDVYSLGVVLYELLAGQRPYELPSGRPPREVLLQAEPRRPSQAASSRDAGKQLAGDLDWIVLRALEKAPERRYSTAAAMTADLGRYLRHEPVEAGPPRLSYRLAKFARRHWAGVTAAAVASLALIAGTIAATAGLLRAREAEAVARAEAASAARVSNFLTGLFEASSPEQARGRDVTARELLDRGAGRIEAGLREEPLVRAKLLRTLGYVYTNLGLYPKAQQLLEQAVAVSTDQNAKGEREYALALGRLANVHRLTEKHAEAEKEFRESLEILERQGAPVADTGPVMNSFAILLAQRDPAAASNLYRRAYEKTAAELGPGHADTAAVLANMGALDLRRRRYHDALKNLESAYRVGLESMGKDDFRLAVTAGNLSIAYRETGNLSKAREFAQRDLDLSTRTLGAGHPGLAPGWLSLAQIHSAAGDTSEALTAAETAESILAPHHPPEHSHRVIAANLRALNLTRLGRLGEARTTAGGTAMLRPASPVSQSAVLESTIILAEIERRAGRHALSLVHAERVIADPSKSRTAAQLAAARWARAWALLHLGRRGEAEAESQRAREASRSPSVTASVRMFTEAKYFACAGESAKALAILRDGARAGTRHAQVSADPAFATVRSMPEAAEVLSALDPRRVR